MSDSKKINNTYDDLLDFGYKKWHVKKQADDAFYGNVIELRWTDDFKCKDYVVKNVKWPSDTRFVVYYNDSKAANLFGKSNKDVTRLKKVFCDKFVSHIKNDDFEYGIESRVDIFVRESFAEYKLYIKEWINSLYLEYFDNVELMVGILRVVSRMNYDDISPEGPTMATAALTHRNIEVRECAIRAFENWESHESLKILENIKVSPLWLQKYVETVVDDLKRELNVSSC